MVRVALILPPSESFQFRDTHAVHVDLTQRIGDLLQHERLDVGLDLFHQNSTSFFSNHRKMAGSTRSVSRVDVMRPPMTTVARGRWTPPPSPSPRSMGTTPRRAASAVMRTCRSRVIAPSNTASGMGFPPRLSWLI